VYITDIMNLTNVFSVSLILASQVDPSYAAHGLFGHNSEKDHGIQEIMKMLHERGKEHTLSTVSEQTILQVLNASSSRGLRIDENLKNDMVTKSLTIFSSEHRQVEEKAKIVISEGSTFHNLPAQTRLGQETCEGLCNGGLPPINPTEPITDINGDGIPETCAELDVVVKTLPTNHPICEVNRFEVQQFCCGCDGICINGKPPLYPDLVLDVDITGDGKRDTCNDLEAFVKTIPANSNLCRVDRLEAQPYCCSSESRCKGICPGGMGPKNPDALIDWFDPDYDGKPDTCLEVHNVMIQLPDFEDICHNIPEDVLFTCCFDDYSDDKTSYTCESACPFGRTIPTENLSRPLELPNYNTTCGEFASSFPFETQSSDMCDEIQYYVAQECGCGLGACGSLCADGSLVTEEFRDVEVDESGLTCRDMESFASNIAPDESECPFFHAIGHKRCGCPTLPPSANDCSFCADGSSLSEEYRYNGIGLGANTSCWYAEIEALFVDINECPLSQNLGYEFCGCPTAPEPAEEPCEICGNGFSTNEDFFIADAGATCGTIQRYAELVPSATASCADAKLFTYEDCCSGDLRCPDKNYTEFSVYSKTNPIRPCSWINTLNKWQTNKFCSPEESNGMVQCPYACAGLCSCEDKKWNKFILENGREKTCYWLARKTKKQIRRVCKKNPAALQTCPQTCEGWCYFK